MALIYRQDSFRVLDVRTLGVLTGGDRPTRDILYVAGVLTGTGDTVHVFVNHWPSKFGGEEYTRPFRQAASDTLVRGRAGVKGQPYRKAAFRYSHRRLQ